MTYTFNRRLLRWGKYALMVAMVALLIYWIRFSPVSVAGHKVGKGEIVAEVMGTGTLEARIQTVISSKIAGRIERIRVDQGDQVKSGDILLYLDDSELKQQVEIAQSTLAAARVSVDRFQADETRAQVVLDQIRRDHLRLQKLFANLTISSNEIEKSQKDLSVAEADLARSKAAVAEARKNLIVAQNTLDYQRARLEDTVIRAPFDGLIVRRDREPGDVVVPGSAIFLLISTEELWVRAWVDETEMEKVDVGQKARVLFRSEPDRSYAGQVARLGRETDRETREFLVDVRVESLPKNWSVGQRAEAFIEVARKTDAVVLPSSLILRREGKTGVYVEEKGQVAWRPLKIGLRGREKVEIIEGVNPESLVILPKDSKRFFEGRRVEVELP